MGKNVWNRNSTCMYACTVCLYISDIPVWLYNMYWTSACQKKQKIHIPNDAPCIWNIYCTYIINWRQMINVRIFHTLWNIWDIDQPELKWIELFLLGCWIFSHMMCFFSSASCAWGLSFDTTRKIQKFGWNVWNPVIEMIYCKWHHLTWSYFCGYINNGCDNARQLE